MSRVTPKTSILYPASTTPPTDNVIEFSCEGYSKSILVLGAPGSGNSYAYSITNRIPASEGGAASAYETTALTSGTASGTSTVSVNFERDFGDIKITVSSPSGTPIYAAHFYRSC